MKTVQQLINLKKYKEVISIAPHRPVFDALVAVSYTHLSISIPLSLAIILHSKIIITLKVVRG